MREAGALAHPADALADAAHTLAGSAGMFGFTRLATMGRGVERAVQTSAADLPARADELRAAVEATLHEIAGRRHLDPECGRLELASARN